MSATSQAQVRERGFSFVRAHFIGIYLIAFCGNAVQQKQILIRCRGVRPCTFRSVFAFAISLAVCDLLCGCRSGSRIRSSHLQPARERPAGFRPQVRPALLGLP
jgi:hypothetical protein